MTTGLKRPLLFLYVVQRKRMRQVYNTSCTIIILSQVLKNNECTLAVDNDSGAEDTVVVVQIKQTDTSEKVLDEIARNIWQRVYSKAGVGAVPLRVLVSSTVIYNFVQSCPPVSLHQDSTTYFSFLHLPFPVSTPLHISSFLPSPHPKKFSPYLTPSSILFT